MPDTGYESLQLGDEIFEALPWDRKTIRRHVCRVQTETFLRYEGSTPEDVRVVRASSGGFTGVGERIDKGNWLRKYFPDRESARRACCEQAVELEKERAAQVAKEIAALQHELKN
jgi:hypothetical protein